MLDLVHPAVPRWYHGYQDFHNSKKPVFFNKPQSIKIQLYHIINCIESTFVVHMCIGHF